MFRREQNGRIWGSSVSILAECAVDGEFTDTYAAGNYKWAASLEIQTGASVFVEIWSGYLTAESYSEPDIAPPYDVQLIATDGLGLLKSFTVSDLQRVLLQMPSTVSLRELLTYASQLGRIPGGIAFLLNGDAKTSSGDEIANIELLDKVRLDLPGLYEESLYDVLERTLATLHAVVLRYGGWTVVVNENALSPQDAEQYLVDAATGSAVVFDMMEIGSMSEYSWWPVGNFQKTVSPARQSVQVQTRYTPKPDLLKNPDMQTDSQWTKGSQVTHSAAAQAYVLPVVSGGVSTSRDISQVLTLRGPIRRNLELEVQAGATEDKGCLLDVYIRGRVTNQSSPYYNKSMTLRLPTARTAGKGVGDNPALIWSASTGYLFNAAFEINKDSRGGASSFHITIPLQYADPSTSGHGRRFPYPHETGFQDIDEITIYIEGEYTNATTSLNIYAAHLKDASGMTGWEETLRISNGALTSAEPVEVLPVPVADDYSRMHATTFEAFVYGPNGEDVLSWKAADDADWSDQLGYIARENAKGVAAPRLILEGRVNVPANADGTSFLFQKDGSNYMVQTSEWDMLNDELTLEMLSVPDVALTVSSATVRPI